MVGAITMTCNDSTWLKKGDSYYRKGRFYEAIDYYNLGLQENPYNTILQTKKGNALYRLGYIRQANGCFYLATTQAGAYEQLRRHVYQHYNNISRNLRNVQQMLKSRYNIPILQNPLKKFLISLKSQIKDQKEREEFEEFKKEIPYRNRILLADYIECYLKHYGSDYKNHIPRFHQFLQEKYYDLTSSELENIIRKQKNKMEKPAWGKQKSIDLMTGREFEEYLESLFKQHGYRVTMTKHNDQGADLVIERYGELTVVQAKRRKGNIGNSAIQEVFTAKHYYDASNALVVTVSDFTQSAKKLAEKLEIELWDRQRLLLEMEKIYLF
jgi:restriction system protein